MYESSMLQKLHLWLVRAELTDHPNRVDSYTLIVVAGEQHEAHRVAIEKIHEHRRVVVKRKSYDTIKVTSSVVEPTKANEILFFCRIKDPRDT